MICPTGEAKYFCKEGWTPLPTNRPTGKSPHDREEQFKRITRCVMPAAAFSISSSDDIRAAPSGKTVSSQ